MTQHSIGWHTPLFVVETSSAQELTPISHFFHNACRSFSDSDCFTMHGKPTHAMVAKWHPKMLIAWKTSRSDFGQVRETKTHYEEMS